MKVKIPDLTKSYPRSPKEKLGGYVHLARMVDKARAKTSNQLGEYIFPCPLDQSLLDYLGIQPEDFSKQAASMDDQGILEWIGAGGKGHSPQQIEDWNKAFLQRTPGNEESMEHFLEIRSKIAPARTDITTWADLLDLDEGREVPVRKRPVQEG